MSLDHLLRRALRAFSPYKPGTSVAEVRRRYGIEHPVKLSQNENPLGTSPRALAALRDIAVLSDYVEDDHRALKERLADLGGAPMLITPAEFGKLIADETEKWGKVIRTAHIKAG